MRSFENGLKARIRQQLEAWNCDYWIYLRLIIPAELFCYNLLYFWVPYIYYSPYHIEKALVCKFNV